MRERPRMADVRALMELARQAGLRPEQVREVRDVALGATQGADAGLEHLLWLSERREQGR